MSDDFHDGNMDSVDTSPDLSDTSSDAENDVSADVFADAPADIPEDVPDSGKDDSVNDASSDIQEDIPEDVPEVIPMDAPEFTPEEIPEDVPEDTSADTALDTHEDQEEKEPLAEQNEVEARLRDDIKDNPEYIDEKGGLKWPENDGFEGEPSKVTLQPGETIDRYGPDGVFTSQAGTPYEERSLPFDKASQDYNAYEVVKPIEGVLQGKTAPAFNQKGEGTQQKLPESVEDLFDTHFLKRK
jgi:hypothetical protein